MEKGIRGVRTVENLIRIALEPLGEVMYIYGGGWNKEDTGAGKASMSFNISKEIIQFAKEQKSDYNFRDYNYKEDISVIEKGLDCSGYIGWVLYNLIGEKKGYVTKSSNICEFLANKGFGSVDKSEGYVKSLPGDIFCSYKNHTYISLGDCEDGSRVLIHSSPPGVQITGTENLKKEKNSKATKLASYYMQKYYKSWYERFPDSSRDISYLTEYRKLNWKVLKDEAKIKKMSAEEVLKHFLGE